MTSILDYLAYYAAKAPEKNAFRSLDAEDVEGKTLSYNEVLSGVGRLGQDLMLRGLAFQRALLLYEDPLQFIIAFLACQYAGMVPIPLPYMKGTRQTTRLINILNDSDAQALCCTEYTASCMEGSMFRNLTSANCKVITTDRSDVHSGPTVFERTLNNDIALIQYTSGSTALPKGVVITNRNLLHNQSAIASAFGCGEESRVYCWLPFHHDMGLIGNLLHTIYAGCTCVILPPIEFVQRPARWLEDITRYRITHSGGPNFAYDLCVQKIAAAELKDLDLSNWSVAYNGSEPIQPRTIVRFSEYFRSAGFKKSCFYPCYGLAEATLLVSSASVSPDTSTETVFRDKVVACSGRIAKGMKVIVVPVDTPLECNDLQEGEICIAGESVTDGYWNKSEEDLFYSIDGMKYLRTGDLGFLLKGELFVTGRIKEMIICRGINMFPYDIEKLVSRCGPFIESNGVVVFGVEAFEDRIVVVTELKREQIDNKTLDELISTIAGIVTQEIGIEPFDVVLVRNKHIPRTTSGKLQRIYCRELYEKGLLRVVRSALANRPGLVVKQEMLLKKALSEPSGDAIRDYLINVIESKAGPLTNGFDKYDLEITMLGMDSLRLTELINCINKELAINLKYSDVSGENTIRDVANVISNLLWLKAAKPTGKEMIL